MTHRPRWKRAGRLMVRWLTHPKPTEWISSLAAVVGVAATIGAAYFLINNGFFDQRKSELESKNNLLEIKNVKLELDTRELTAKRDDTGKQVVKLEGDLESKRGELGQMNARLNEAEKKIETAEAKYQAYARHEDALRVLENLGNEDKKDKVINKQTLPSVKYYGSMRTHDSFEISLNCGNDSYPKSDQMVCYRCYNSVSAVSQLVNIRNLRELSIKNIMLSAKDIEVITKIKGLRKLTLNNCNIEDASMALLNITDTTIDLDLSYNPSTIMPTCGSSLGLVHLFVDGTKFTDKELARVIRCAPALEEVGAQLSAFGDHALAAVSVEKVGTFYLFDSGITLEGLKSFMVRYQPREIHCNRKLITDVEAMNKFITDKGLNITVHLDKYMSPQPNYGIRIMGYEEKVGCKLTKYEGDKD